MSKDSIIDGIVEAQQRLLKENIRANCVVVDRKYIQLRKRLYMTVLRECARDPAHDRRATGGL